MSKYMLSDQNAINDINPFVLVDFSLPGSISTPYKFDDYSTPTEQSAMWDDEEKSVMCNYGKRVGFLGSNMCENPEPNCPMSRLVLPERVIQYEDGSVNTELDVNRMSKQKLVQMERANRMKILILILIIASLVFVLRR